MMDASDLFDSVITGHRGRGHSNDLFFRVTNIVQNFLDHSIPIVPRSLKSPGHRQIPRFQLLSASAHEDAAVADANKNHKYQQNFVY
jgi:hypothetical protein